MSEAQFSSYSTNKEQFQPRRNWQEVITGTLLTAMGVYLIFRGVEEQPQRHTINLATQANQGIEVDETIKIKKSAKELYDYWSKLNTLPSIMRHLKSVEKLDNKRSHWVAKGPLNTNIEWDAEVTYDLENRLIRWKSVENAQVPNQGWVRFSETADPTVTQLNVSLSYSPPLGELGAAVAKLFGEEPSQQISEDLERFKEAQEQA